MERSKHKWAGIVLFISLWICSFFIPYFKYITISSIIVPLLWSTIPDRDRRDSDSHRNLWWHSIIIPMFIFYFNPSIIWILTSLSAGLHCGLDVRFKKVGGYYTIKWYKMKSLDGYWTATIWFISNFVLSIIILIMYFL